MLSLGATLGLLVIFDMYDNLGNLLDLRASTNDIFYYYTIVLPTLLPLILPIAFLVSLLFSLSNLNSNSEIVCLLLIT